MQIKPVYIIMMLVLIKNCISKKYNRLQTPMLTHKVTDVFI